MDSLLAFLPAVELTIFHRILLIWAWIAAGLLVSFQLSQQYSDRPFAWTKLNDRTRPYWYTLYTTTVFLMVQISYPVAKQSLLAEKQAGGSVWEWEVALLDGVWIGLLGLEVAMVFSAVVITFARAFSRRRRAKLKTR